MKNSPIYIDAPSEIDLSDLDQDIDYFTFFDLQERALGGDAAAAAFLDARYEKAQR